MSPPPTKFTASDQFIAWAHSLSGMLTKVRTKYGGVAEMVEHQMWDESQTEYALSLVRSLREQLAQIETELSSHVNEKSGKDGM